MSQNWFSWSSSSFFCFKLFRRIRTVNGLSFTTSQLWQHLTQALLSCMAWWSIAGSWYIGTPSQVPAVHYKSGFQEWKKTKKNELMAIHIKRKLPSVLNDSFHWQAKKFMPVHDSMEYDRHYKRLRFIEAGSPGLQFWQHTCYMTFYILAYLCSLQIGTRHKVMTSTLFFCKKMFSFFETYLKHELYLSQTAWAKVIKFQLLCSWVVYHLRQVTAWTKW